MVPCSLFLQRAVYVYTACFTMRQKMLDVANILQMKTHSYIYFKLELKKLELLFRVSGFKGLSMYFSKYASIHVYM